MKTLQERLRSCTDDNPEPTTRVLCHRQAWRSDPPVGTTGSRKELCVPKTLKVEPQRLIERQRKLVGRVFILAFKLVALADVELLNGGSELLPRALAPC